MAQSDRNLVFHSGTKAYPPRQLCQQANVEDQDRAVHQLFQRHHGQALPLDLRRKASRGIAWPTSQNNESPIPLGCTSLIEGARKLGLGPTGRRYREASGWSL